MGDEEKADKDKELKNKLLQTEKHLGQFAEKIDELYSPDLVISSGTDYVYFSPVYEYFKKRNKFHHIFHTMFDETKIITDSYRLYPATEKFDEYKSKFPTMDDTMRAELYGFMKNRRKTAPRGLGKYKYINQTRSSIEKLLNYNSNKRNIFLFPNVHWDIGIGEQNFLFDDIVDWVGKTFEIVKQYEHLHLYIKPHPDEEFGKNRGDVGVIECAVERGYSFPNNASIIKNAWGINPFDMFEFVDLGITASGTIGLEMMYSETDCINVGTAPYSGTVLDRSPSSVFYYESALKSNDNPIKPERIDIDSFLHFYFIDELKSWPLTKRCANDERFTVTKLNAQRLDQLEMIFNEIEQRASANYHK